MRATLAGKNIKVVISIDVFTPNGLTIDNKAEKVYFSDGSLGKIERCEYDGSNRHVSTVYCTCISVLQSFENGQIFFFLKNINCKSVLIVAA